MLEKMKAEFEKWHRFPVTDDMDMQTEVAWMNWQAAWNAGISAATGWRDVVDELPNEAQEVLFVRNRKTVHGAWIGGIFWHNNEKCAAATWRPMPEPPSGNRIGAILPELSTCTKSQTDIQRYQWLRGGSDVPPHSVRWPRFEVRTWDGRHWQTLFAEQLDTEIDAAMSRDLAHNASNEGPELATVPLD